MKFFPIGLFLISASAFLGAPRAEDSAWVSILPAPGLAGWTPYYQKGPANPDSSWGVTPEGWLNINIHLSLNVTGIGHLFYTKRKLSYYMVRSVYRFTSTTSAPDWGGGNKIQNNGLMIHSQDPKTMNGKDFPFSFETQLIGPANTSEGGTSANLCLPGTTVSINGGDRTNGCFRAKYPTAWSGTKIPWEDPDGWSDATARVLGDSLVQYFIHGAKVNEYTKLRLNGSPVKDGYLAVQAEGTSTQFKVLDILDLTGCMDNTKPGYRSYFVKSDPQTCAATGIGERHSAAEAPGLERAGAYLVMRGSGASISQVRRANGTAVGLAAGARSFAPDRAGIYLVAIRSAAGISVRKVAWY